MNVPRRFVAVSAIAVMALLARATPRAPASNRGESELGLPRGGSSLIAQAAPQKSAPGSAAPGGQGLGRNGWTTIDYSALVDTRRLSHSGESVGMLLQRLEGRDFPTGGERPDDATAHVLLDPLLEPYAFVLSDALDTLAPVSGLVELGSLWQPGEAQPAWAELLRSRSLIVESDGQGKLRACLPWVEASERGPASGGADNPSVAPADAGHQAWDEAWPVLRHVLAAERRRLAKKSGAAREGPALDVDVYPFVHDHAKTLFRLGLVPYHVKVTDTSGRGERAPLDLAAWQSFLDHGLQLEGGRLDADGTVRLLGSDVAAKPSVLGRPLGLADFAVAYRAVLHGGLGEPYMSLDRGDSPQTSLVNYGGRLQDTSLGLVSLLCDVRFKTFSLGIDVLAGKDMRDTVRHEIPGFRTHNERFAADARSKGVLTQQTRLWFYPDAVDLTLSAEGDVLVMRRVRMSAASERVQQETFTAAREPDPPWTVETVNAINRDYALLSRFFPELADLDQVVRLLSFFTWLRQAALQGMDVPDLDALLALELPPEPTPRRFPQLLAYNAMPPAGETGPVQIYNRISVGEALDTLLPRSGSAFPARRRLQRALAGLDRRQGDQAALAQELEGYDPGSLDESSLDLLAYRAERLRMHHYVLNTLPAKAREEVAHRKQESEVRTISVGIGGLDLGMGKALARAASRTQRAEGERPPAGGPAARRKEGSVEAKDSPLLPAIVTPDHGLTPAGASPGRRASSGAGTGAETSETIYRAHWIEKGSVGAGAASSTWIQSVMGADGPSPRVRRLILGPDGAARTIERWESGRFLVYALERGAAGLRAVTTTEALGAPALEAAAVPPGARRQAASPPAAAELPAGLTTLEIDPSTAGESTAAEESPTKTSGSSTGGAELAVVRLRVRAAGGKELTAPVPRPILQRLVLGREADLTPDRPLPGLSPAEKILGPSRSLMVLMNEGQRLPPWATISTPLAGEEDPARIAAALRRWWAADAGEGPSPSAVVGTDALAIGRWRAVSGLGAKVTLVLQDDAFPGRLAALKDSIKTAWKGSTAGSINASSGASTIVLVSAEDPALLGARLREISTSAAMKGRLLAVWPLGGPVRADLPASLLAEGNLNAIGIADYSPIAAGRVAAELAALSSALSDARAKERRPEDLPAPLTWYY